MKNNEILSYEDILRISTIMKDYIEAKNEDDKKALKNNIKDFVTFIKTNTNNFEKEIKVKLKKPLKEKSKKTLSNVLKEIFNTLEKKNYSSDSIKLANKILQKLITKLKYL